MSNKPQSEEKPIQKLDVLVLQDWIAAAGAGIITLDEAIVYMGMGYMKPHEVARMFPNHVNELKPFIDRVNKFSGHIWPCNKAKIIMADVNPKNDAQRLTEKIRNIVRAFIRAIFSKPCE